MNHGRQIEPADRRNGEDRRIQFRSFLISILIAMSAIDACAKMQPKYEQAHQLSPEQAAIVERIQQWRQLGPLRIRQIARIHAPNLTAISNRAYSFLDSSVSF